MSETPSKQPPAFAEYDLRELPIAGTFHSLAGEIAALLDRADRQKQADSREHQGQIADLRETTGRAAQLVHHLDQGLKDCSDSMAAAGLGKAFRRLRIIKDQLKDHLAREGYTWQDPTGQPFTNGLAECVQVDGWRHSDEFAAEVVVETREPIVRFGETLLLPGAVTVGAPDT